MSRGLKKVTGWPSNSLVWPKGVYGHLACVSTKDSQKTVTEDMVLFTCRSLREPFFFFFGLIYNNSQIV